MPRRGTAHKRSAGALAPRIVRRLNISITAATRSCSCPPWKVCSCTIQDFHPDQIVDDSASTVKNEKEADIAFVASYICAGSVEARSSTEVKEEPKQLTYAKESNRLSAELQEKKAENVQHGVTEVELTEDELESADVPTGKSPSRTSEVSEESGVPERVELKPGPGAHTTRRSRSRSRTPIPRKTFPWQRAHYGSQRKAASSYKHWPDARGSRR